MHIYISTIGDTAANLLTAQSPFTLALPKAIGNLALNWEVQPISGELRPDELLMLPDQPRVLLIDMEADFNYRDIRLAQSKVFSFIKNHPGLPYLYAPLIAVFDKVPAPTLVHDIRDLVSDWVITETDSKDIANRIIFSLAKKNILKNINLELDVIFSLPSKTISFKGESMQLSPTEYALAEIFFGHINETISLKDLVTFFQSIGSSTSMNNIRVVIFHLRMKLDQLTQNNWILSSIYRRGYVLRRARPNHHKTQPSTKPLNENL